MENNILTKEMFEYIEKECDKFREMPGRYEVPDYGDVIYTFFNPNKVLNDWDEGKANDAFWNDELNQHSCIVFINQVCEKLHNWAEGDNLDCIPEFYLEDTAKLIGFIERHIKHINDYSDKPVFDCEFLITQYDIDKINSLVKFSMLDTTKRQSPVVYIKPRICQKFMVSGINVTLFITDGK